MSESASPYYRLELLVNPEARDLYSQEILYREDTNAGFDLFVSKHYEPKRGEVSLLDLGCKARMLRVTDGHTDEVHYWLAPRSSIWKSGVMMANSMGIIDKSYRGPLMGAVVPLPERPDGEYRKILDVYTKVYADCDRVDRQPIRIQRGQRLFQILAPDMGWIREVHLVDLLPETSRGEGGFGSTGR